jgi:hypothetical protein
MSKLETEVHHVDHLRIVYASHGRINQEARKRGSTNWKGDFTNDYLSPQ